MTAMFEMYGIPSATPMAVGFEVVPAAGGTPKVFRPTGQQTTAEPDKFQIFGEVPAGLTAGDYLIRGVVQQQGSEKGTTQRTLRIVKK